MTNQNDFFQRTFRFAVPKRSQVIFSLEVLPPSIMKRTIGILLSWQKPEGGFGGKEREVLYKKTRKHQST